MQWCQWTHHEYDVVAAAVVAMQQSHSHRKWKENQKNEKQRIKWGQCESRHFLTKRQLLCVLGVINRFTHFCACYNACDPRECANDRM